MANIHDLGFPFTSVSGDRQYSASEWREYFDALVTGGVVGDIENELQVKPQGVPNKTVYVDTGAIMIKGAMRSVTSVINLTLADNTSGNPRIDRIVARINYTDRKIEFVVKQGTPGASPAAPSLTRNTTYWEMSLAQIAIANGYSTITSGNITDERLDETVCGYFKYRAKPAWYPQGQVPVDAWMYAAFKDQLTAGEIADIEANSSLMAIINGSNLIKLQEWDLLGMLTGEALFERNSLEFGDVVYSTNGTLPNARVLIYDNLTINAGVTLAPAYSGIQIIIVKETLTLNGTLNFNGKGAAGAPQVLTTGNAGGAGGGAVVIAAANVVGTGSIMANGINGGNPTSYGVLTAGNAGNASEMFGEPCNAGGGAATDGNRGGGGTANINRNIMSRWFYIQNVGVNDSGGAGGGSGATDNSTGANRAGAGGGGGAGAYGAGGNGASNSYSTSYVGTGGGGGGGGGFIAISTKGSIPALNLSANGGAGGNGYPSAEASGGGGGGGGQIVLVADSSSATVAVTGGTGGTGIANGDAGAAGIARLF